MKDWIKAQNGTLVQTSQINHIVKSAHHDRDDARVFVVTAYFAGTENEYQDLLSNATEADADALMTAIRQEIGLQCLDVAFVLARVQKGGRPE